jgi:6-phosphogluconate dehydrogenase (decarboxylating)
MKNITVIGSGTMGNGIAHVFAQNNYHVSLVDVNEAALKKAIDTINSEKQVDNILVFSDNMAIAKQILPNTYTFIENESNIIDLIFMSMCSNNIIGNSTFSWWSAYLNKTPNKVVIAPNTNWFGGQLSSLDRSDLFPESWITF